MTVINVLQLSSAIGLIISLYFYCVYKGYVSGFFSPRKLCARNTCHDILKTPFAHIFKVPNFSLGIFYYIAVFAFTLVEPVPAVSTLLLVISWLVVILSVYLTYALFFVLEIDCILCYAAHIANVVIAICIFMLY